MIIDGKQSIVAKNEMMVAAVYPPPNPNRILSFQVTSEKYDQSVGTRRIDIAAIKINNIDKRFRMPEKTLNDRSFLIKGRIAPMANIVTAILKQINAHNAPADGSCLEMIPVLYDAVE